MKNVNGDYIGQTISTVKETGYSHASVESFITQDGPRWAEKAHTLQNNHNYKRITPPQDSMYLTEALRQTLLQTFFPVLSVAVWKRSLGLFSSG